MRKAVHWAFDAPAVRTVSGFDRRQSPACVVLSDVEPVVGRMTTCPDGTALNLMRRLAGSSTRREPRCVVGRYRRRAWHYPSATWNPAAPSATAVKLMPPPRITFVKDSVEDSVAWWRCLMVCSIEGFELLKVRGGVQLLRGLPRLVLESWWAQAPVPCPPWRPGTG